jgi:hypothetical protein
MEAGLEGILRAFAWGRMDQVFADLLPAAQPPAAIHDASPVAA